MNFFLSNQTSNSQQKKKKLRPFEFKNEFASQIRKKDRQKKISSMRTKYFKLIPKQINQNQFVQYFQLKDDPRFTPQLLKNNEFILVDILLAKSDNLTRLSFKNLIFPQVDEKLLPEKESQFEVEEIYLPKQYPFKLQTSFFDALALDFYQNAQKYKELQKGKQKQLINFWINFLKRNKYTETGRDKEYHLSIITFLQHFVCCFESPDLRETIFSWVGGPESLVLIFNCLPGYFMNYHNYKRLYDIILIGLRHKEVEMRMEAIDVLRKNIKNSDWDDISSLLKYRSELFTSLVLFFNDYQINSRMYQKEQYLETMKKAAICVNNFLSTYDEQVSACLKEGAGYVGAKLICQRDRDLMKEGLRIFQNIARIEDKSYSKQCLDFLIYNTSIRQTEAWHRMGKTYDFIMHEDIQVRRSFIEFISSYLANAEFHEIISLSCLFQLPGNEGFTDMLRLMFVENEDPIILRNVLQSFRSLIYYCESLGQEDSEMELLENQYGNLYPESLSLNAIVQKIDDPFMMNKLSQLEDKGEFLDGNLKEEVEVIIQFIETIKQRFEI